MSTPSSTTTSGQMQGGVLSLATSGAQPLACLPGMLAQARCCARRLDVACQTVCSVAWQAMCVPCRFILVIEKDAVFQRLFEDSFPSLEPSIMVTGKGMPDMATREYFGACHFDPSAPCCMRLRLTSDSPALQCEPSWYELMTAWPAALCLMQPSTWQCHCKVSTDAQMLACSLSTSAICSRRSGHHQTKPTIPPPRPLCSPCNLRLQTAVHLAVQVCCLHACTMLSLTCLWSAWWTGIHLV